MCLKKLKAFISRWKKPAPSTEIVEAKKEKPPTRWWHFPFRMIRTSAGGMNMPKYQRCPECGAASKRQSKTAGGANYRCRRTHGSFFVGANRRQLV